MRLYKDIGLLTLKGERFAKKEYAKCLLRLSKAYGFNPRNSKEGVTKDGCFVIDLGMYFPYFHLILFSLISKEVGIKEDTEYVKSILKNLLQIEPKKIPDFEDAVDSLRKLLLMQVYDGRLRDVIDLLRKVKKFTVYVVKNFLIGLDLITQGWSVKEPFILLYEKFLDELEKLKRNGFLNEDLTFKVPMTKFLDYIKTIYWQRIEKVQAEDITNYKPLRICIACGKAFIPYKNRIFCKDEQCQKVRHIIKAKINHLKNKGSQKRLISAYLKARQQYPKLSLKEQKKERQEMLRRFSMLLPKDFNLFKKMTPQV